MDTVDRMSGLLLLVDAWISSSCKEDRCKDVKENKCIAMTQLYANRLRSTRRPCIHLCIRQCSRSCWRAMKPSALRLGRSLSEYVTLLISGPGHSPPRICPPHACQGVIVDIPQLNRDVSCFIVWVDDEDDMLRWTDHLFAVCLVPSGGYSWVVGHHGNLCGDWVKLGGLHLNLSRQLFCLPSSSFLHQFISVLSPLVILGLCLSIMMMDLNGGGESSYSSRLKVECKWSLGKKKSYSGRLLSKL